METINKLFNESISKYDTMTQNVITISTTMITLVLTFIAVMNSQKYMSIPILMSEIISKIWILSSTHCDTLKNIPINASIIFNELIIYFSLFLMLIYAIYYRNYIAFIWIIMQPTLELFKGLSCGIENILSI